MKNLLLDTLADQIIFGTIALLMIIGFLMAVIQSIIRKAKRRELLNSAVNTVISIPLYILFALLICAAFTIVVFVAKAMLF